MKKTLLFFIVSLLFSTVIMAQWSNNPAENNRITPVENSFHHVEFKVNQDNITYVMFLVPMSGGSSETRIQILDKDGVKILPEEGKTISNYLTRTWFAVNYLLTVDNQGNAIVVVSDCRNSSEDILHLTYAAYKISPTGEMLWGEDGIDLLKGGAQNLLGHMQIVQLEDDSYMFAWTQSYGSSLCIQMQRLSVEGDFLWEDGVFLAENNVQYSYPYLVNAGNNQVVLVYTKTGNQDIYVRKVDFDGSSVWPEDTRGYRGGFGTLPAWSIVRVVSDNKGGVFIGWNDDRMSTNKESTYVSYVKSNGELGFTAGEEGQKVGYSEYLRGFKPEMLYHDEENCLFVVWRETSPGQGQQHLVLQKLSMTGELLWDSEGVEVTPLENVGIEGDYSIQKGPDGQIALFYVIHSATVYSDSKNYVSLMSCSDGSFIWDEEKALISTGEGRKSDFKSSRLIDGEYWLTAWVDSREIDEDSKKRLYMQLVTIDGKFETQPSQTSIENIYADNTQSLSVFPTMIDESAKFIVNNCPGAIDISVYSIDGKKVSSVLSGYTNETSWEVNWNAKAANVLSGMYIVVLTTPEKTESTRIVIK